MLITFSGSVGSGKSSFSRALGAHLNENKYPFLNLRFRFLSWRKITKDVRTAKKCMPAGQPPGRPKKSRSQLRSETKQTLGVRHFLGYALRMLNFKMLLRWKLKNTIAICDRYFYDNFAHYKLQSPVEVFLFGLLVRMMPKPDLAFLCKANSETIIKRRNYKYAPDYLEATTKSYGTLKTKFPDLLELDSDQPANSEQFMFEQFKYQA